MFYKIYISNDNFQEFLRGYLKQFPKVDASNMREEELTLTWKNESIKKDFFFYVNPSISLPLEEGLIEETTLENIKTHLKNLNYDNLGMLYLIGVSSGSKTK